MEGGVMLTSFIATCLTIPASLPLVHTFLDSLNGPYQNPAQM